MTIFCPVKSRPTRFPRIKPSQTASLMKNYFMQLRTTLLLSAALLTAHSVSAAESVALTASPAVLNVNAGSALSATTVTITYIISGGSTAVNFATSLPLTPTGMTVSALSKTSDTVSGTLTFTVSTTTATPAGAYTIDFNASGGASLSIPIVVVVGPEWTGGGADTNWSTAANWSFAVSSSSLVDFNQGKVGSIGVVNNAVSASTTVNSLAYTFGTTGGSGYEVTQISPSQTLTVAENLTVGLDNVTTHVVMTNTGNFTVTGDASSYFSVGAGNSENATKQTAVLVLADGVNTITAASMWIGDSSGNNGNSGNLLSLGNGNNTINADTIIIAHGKASGTLNFNAATVNGGNGTVIIRNRAGTGRAAITIGNGTSGSGACTGALTLTGHSADVKAGTVIIGAVGSDSGSQSGTVSFDYGTFDVTSILMADSTTSASTGPSAGTLTVGGSTTAATLTVNSAGGGSFVLSDNANGTSHPGTGTFNLNANGIAQVYCSITKAAAANNSGTVNINGGTLIMEAVADTVGTPAIPIDTLNLATANIHLNVNGLSIGTNIVATTVTSSGTTTITIDSVVGLTGTTTFPLISYTGTDPFPSLAGLASVLLPSGYTGNLVDDTTKKTIDVSISSSTPSLVWAGAVSGGTLDGNWNTSDLNWLNGATYSAYADPDTVQFDDTASTSTVNLATTLSPGILNVTNNALNYVFTGSGGIGASSLTKQGPGTLTIDNSAANAFTSVNIANGVLQVGNNDANGSLEAAGVTDNGSLVFNRTGSTTVTNVISGSGTVSITNTVIMTGSNLYSGATTINASSTLQVGDGTTSTAQLGNAFNPAGASAVTDNGTLAFSLSASPSSGYSNNISGGGSIQILANGHTSAIKLNGNNTAFAGSVIVGVSNRLELDSSINFFPASVPVTVQTNAALFLNTSGTYGGNISIIGTGYIGDGNPAPYGAIRFGSGSATLVTEIGRAHV